MAAERFLKEVTGEITEQPGLVTSSGPGDDGRILALGPDGRLDLSVMPPGIGPVTANMEAAEALAAGDWVNIYDDAGTMKARRADAAGPGQAKHADGYVLAATSIGQTAMVYMDGTNNQVTGLSVGTVFLSTTPGQGSNTAPQAAGNFVQEVGVFVEGVGVHFHQSKPITKV